VLCVTCWIDTVILDHCNANLTRVIFFCVYATSLLHFVNRAHKNSEIVGGFKTSASTRTIILMQQIPNAQYKLENGL
jgi:hypothetical protein